MFDTYEIRKLLRDAIDEQGEQLKAELAAGVDAEREEEIRDWFALQEMRKRVVKANQQREERREKDSVLATLPPPELLN
jgi:hypothetical protein